MYQGINLMKLEDLQANHSTGRYPFCGTVLTYSASRQESKFFELLFFEVI